MLDLTARVPDGVAHQFARDQATIIKRPAAVVDLGQCVPSDHRRVFIARQLKREQIIRS